MSCGGSERIRGSKLMSLAPALLTQHTAPQLMGSLAGWQTGSHCVCVCQCTWVNEWASGQAMGNLFMQSECQCCGCVFVHLCACVCVGKYGCILSLCACVCVLSVCVCPLPTEPYLSQPSGFRSLGCQRQIALSLPQHPLSPRALKASYTDWHFQKIPTW